MQILGVSWVKETLCEAKLGWGVLSPGPEKDSAVPGATWERKGMPAQPHPPTRQHQCVRVRVRVRACSCVHACMFVAGGHLK